jgi:hypothetical protein
MKRRKKLNMKDPLVRSAIQSIWISRITIIMSLIVIYLHYRVGNLHRIYHSIISLFR